MGKKLVVNADDFGLSAEVNAGIIKAFRNGILTSTSLMCTSEGFDDAVRLAVENPGLDIGFHVTLVEEPSVLAKHAIPSLVNGRGVFKKSAKEFFKAYVRGSISVAEVRQEVDAQFAKLMDRGVSVTHIDSHQHIHALPGILEIVADLAKKHGIRYIRLPGERIHFDGLLKGQRLTRAIQQMVLNGFCRYSQVRVQEYLVDHFFGFADGGHLDALRLSRIIRRLPEGVSELMCHPGSMDDGATAGKYRHWRYNWETELGALVSEDVRRLIEENGIELVSFRDI